MSADEKITPKAEIASPRYGGLTRSEYSKRLFAAVERDGARRASKAAKKKKRRETVAKLFPDAYLIPVGRARRSLSTVAQRHVRKLVLNARRRAFLSGRAFDPELLVALTASPPTRCRCCGKPLDYTSGRGHLDRDCSPSLDRKNNLLGYVVGNVEIICWRCNVLKSDGSREELAAVARYAP